MKLKNRVHAELDRRDIDLNFPLFTRGGRELLRCLGIDCVNQLLSVMEVLDCQIREVSAEIKSRVWESDAVFVVWIVGQGHPVRIAMDICVMNRNSRSGRCRHRRFACEGGGV